MFWNKRLARRIALGCFTLFTTFVEPAIAACEYGRLCGAFKEFHTTYRGEVWHNPRGGIKQSSLYLDNLDLTWTIDSKTLGAASGGKLFLYGLYNNAAELSANLLGDAQIASNIDAPKAFRLFEAWYEQTLLNGQISLLFGLHNLNSEFDVLTTRGLFIHSAHGIGTDFSQSGKSGPSIFPASSLGFRALWNIDKTWSVRGAIYDGVPGDPNGSNKTVIALGNGDGVLGVVELAYQNEAGLVAKMGYWRYSAEFEHHSALDPTGAPLRRSGNDGFYIEGELPVYQEPHDHHQGLALFLRYGRAEDNINAFDSFLSAGGVYTGLLPGRPHDRLGFAVAIAKNGDPFLRAQALAGTPAETHEINFELTYHMPITHRLALHPDIQYIINPGTNPHLKDVLVFGLRFEIHHDPF